MPGAMDIPRLSATVTEKELPSCGERIFLPIRSRISPHFCPDLPPQMDARDLKKLISLSAETNAPMAIRYPKGCEDIDGLVPAEEFVYTDSNYHANDDIIILTYGRIFREALKAKELLSKKDVKCSVAVLEKILPYKDSYELVKKYCVKAKKLIIIEESMESGSFGQNIVSLINADNGFDIKTAHLAIRGEIPGHARLKTLYRNCGISAEDIAEEAMR